MTLSDKKKRMQSLKQEIFKQSDAYDEGDVPVSILSGETR